MGRVDGIGPETLIFDLTGKVAIVTGGSGYLGSAIALGLGDLGASVFDASRTSGVDVTDWHAFQQLCMTVRAEESRLDILVNCAGSAKRLQDVIRLSPRDWTDGFTTTIDQYFTCCQHVYELMRPAGSIINIASLFGFLAPKFDIYPEGIRGPAVHHAAAKAGVLGMTTYLAALWAKEGIRVNAVSPGFFPKPGPIERKDWMETLEKEIPMGRVGKPDDIVGAVAFLASDASRYVTGQNLVVDGGYSIW